jgi:hypothetical protein
LFLVTLLIIGVTFSDWEVWNKKVTLFKVSIRQPNEINRL